MKLFTIYITNNATAYGGAQSLRQVVLFVFVPDGNGMRYKKTVGMNTTEYYLDGSQILAEYREAEQSTIIYIYDVSGIAGMIYKGQCYYFDKNQLGDIVGIYNESGQKVGEYVYDAWGNILYKSGSMADINPFRYRGYYYDVETGFYYLQTRYYDPTICRFINADDYELVSQLASVPGQLNMYAYCGNNPIMYTDTSGNFAISTLIIGAIIGAVIGAISSTISQGLTKGWDNINGCQVLLDAALGGISGALGASGINQVVSMIAGGVLGATGSIGGDLIASRGDWSQVNIGKAILMGVIGVGLGRWTGAGTQNAKAMVSTINAGKSWGSKAFLISAKEASLRPNSGLTLQTMYMNMSKAINLYTVQGMAKVTVATFGSTFLGNFVGW